MPNLPFQVQPAAARAGQDRQAARPPAAKPGGAVAALVSAPAGHRRWTVVIPRRLSERAAQAAADAEAFHAAQPATPGPIRYAPQATMFGLIAAIASGLFVYSAKHAAATLDGQIAQAIHAAGAANQQASLLRAEWSLLNNPDRLHALADRYLALQATDASQFVPEAALHARLPPVLYGPMPPEPDRDDAPDPAAGRRLLAMAAPAAPAEAPPDPPVVTAPQEAVRVLAHAGPPPALVDPEPALPAAQAAGRRDAGLAVAAAEDAPRAAMRAAPRPAMTPAPAPAPRLMARAELRPRLYRPPTLMRPELIRALLEPRDFAAHWQPRPKLSWALATPQPPRHAGQGRSEPPHDLMLPQAAPAPAAAARYAPPEHRAARAPDGQPPNYHPAAPFAYRPYRPYWAYNAAPPDGTPDPRAYAPMYPLYR